MGMGRRLRVGTWGGESPVFRNSSWTLWSCLCRPAWWYLQGCPTSDGSHGTCRTTPTPASGQEEKPWGGTIPFWFSPARPGWGIAHGWIESHGQRCLSNLKGRISSIMDDTGAMLVVEGGSAGQPLSRAELSPPLAAWWVPDLIPALEALLCCRRSRQSVGKYRLHPEYLFDL